MLLRTLAFGRSVVTHRHVRSCGSTSTARSKFKDFVRPELVTALSKQSIFAPNAVQAEALPLTMKGKHDVIVCAQTGSGKTLLFLLPILQHLSQHAPPPHSAFTRSRRHRAVRRNDDDDGFDFGGNHRRRGRRREADRILAQPEAVVLVPTRELALQIANVAQQLARHLVDGTATAEASEGADDVRLPPELLGELGGPTVRRDGAAGAAHPVSVLTLSNGQRFTPEREALRKEGGARLVIATPARLLYHLEEKSLSLRRLRHVAIDEADAVLCGADGVQREGADVIQKLKRQKARHLGRTVDRKFVLTAATIAGEHDTRISELFPKARRVSHAGVLVPTLRTVYHYVRSNKDEELLRLLEAAQDTPFLHEGATVIFCGSAGRASRVHGLLTAAMPELDAQLIHGETRPAQRQLALQKFHDDESRFLVASDVATRGLDFPLVRHVINYDVPRDVGTFIHRAGRTARQGLPGLLTCLVKPFEQPFYNKLRKGEGSGSPLQQQSGRAGKTDEGGAKVSTLSPLELQSPEQRAWRWSTRRQAKTLNKLSWKAALEKARKSTPADPALGDGRYEDEPPVVEFPP